MAEMDIRQQITADELLNLPDDGKRYELIEGELVEMAPAGYEHGGLAAFIIWLLVGWARKTDAGRVQSSETGFRTREDAKTVRAPDASFMSYARVPKGEKITGYATIAPDLVVEVISPNDRTGDIDDKTQEWLDFGVRMVWNVYPARKQVHVYTPEVDKPDILFADDVLNGGDVLPGFSVKISELFEN